MSEGQMELGTGAPRASDHRVKVLATVLAGFTWPERGSFEKLRGPQKLACLQAARVALDYLDAAKSESE
jgi:hypothetical protein